MMICAIQLSKNKLHNEVSYMKTSGQFEIELLRNNYRLFNSPSFLDS